MKIIILLMGLFFLTSCKLIDFILNPNSYVKIKVNQDYTAPLVNDTILLINSEGNFAPPPTKQRPPRRYILSNIGDNCIIRDKEFVEIVFNEVDFTLASLDIKKNHETKEILVSLVPFVSEVVLENKCQTIIRSGNFNSFPPISVKQGLNPEQVVITPVVDDSCAVIGYEIRYGSEERGCRKVAEENLKRFYNCLKYNKPFPKTTKFTRCYHLFFFNLKCK